MNQHAEKKEDGSLPEREEYTLPPAAAPSDWMFLQPAILDQMHDAIIAMDLEGVVTGCNRAAEQVYGYSAKELIGHSAAVVYAKEDRFLFHKEVVPCVLRQGEYRGELRNRTRSGDTIYIHVSITLLRNGDGEPAGMVSFSVNVTSQKLGDLAVRRNDDMERVLQAEREDSATMRMLFRAVENAEDVFLMTEAEPVEEPGPRILYVNAAFERMTGYTREEVLGKTPRILQGPKTERAALDRIHKALKRWKPVREEMTNYRKDGSEFTVDLSIVPIANEQGWYTHWMAIQRETTEQKRLRELVVAERSRLSFLTEAMPQLLWTASAGGMCEFVSQACATFLGVPAEACYGQGWCGFIHPEDVERATGAWRDAVAQGQTFIVEYRLRQADGEYRWFLHRAVPRFGASGEILEWVGSSTDVEQQKRSEAALRQT